MPIDIEKLEEHVLECVRQRFDCEPDDDSKDSEIAAMAPIALFEEYLIWQGIIGFSAELWQTVESIKAATIEEQDDVSEHQLKMEERRSRKGGDMEGDPTEMVRRRFMVELARELRKEELGKLYGAVWDSAELAKNYEVLGFMAPFVVVRRLSDGKMGSLAFQQNPRFYFNWVEDDADK